jgi:Ca-activated chloride channel family protein
MGRTTHTTTILLGALALTAALGGCKKAGMGSFAPNMAGDASWEFAPVDRERYAHADDSPFVAVADAPLSTFSVDVDTASYSNTRRFLQDGSLPPVDAVRIEELVNYFDYHYPQPSDDKPFAAVTEVGACPWDATHKLVHIGIQGKHIELDAIPPRNLVFLVDVSGSMQDEDKLPLLKHGLMQLADQLRDSDRVSIVVYAGASGVVLEPTHSKVKIRAALARLRAGGSTNGAAGIQLAYDVAAKSFVQGGINRVILASDGDFNVGPSSDGELVRIIEDKRRSGVYLSVLGFGTGNLNDSAMEQVADHGNGNYAYIDSRAEAKRVLVDQASSTLVPIADDVKLQVEFNPTLVEAYRLIGYENRRLADEDFNDDTKDAGEIGADHTVTALYEIVPAGAGEVGDKVDALQYQTEPAPTVAAASDELMTVKIRYKDPGAAESHRLSFPIVDAVTTQPSEAFRFSAAVASFGMLLRDSDTKGSASFADTLSLARGAVGQDPDGRRKELVSLIQAAAQLSRRG